MQGGRRLMIITLQKVRPKSALKSARPGGDGKKTPRLMSYIPTHEIYIYILYIYLFIYINIHIYIYVCVWHRYRCMYVYIYICIISIYLGKVSHTWAHVSIYIYICKSTNDGWLHYSWVEKNNKWCISVEYQMGKPLNCMCAILTNNLTAVPFAKDFTRWWVPQFLS